MYVTSDVMTVPDSTLILAPGRGSLNWQRDSSQCHQKMELFCGRPRETTKSLIIRSHLFPQFLAAEMGVFNQPVCNFQSDRLLLRARDSKHRAGFIQAGLTAALRSALRSFLGAEVPCLFSVLQIEQLLQSRGNH